MVLNEIDILKLMIKENIEERLVITPIISVKEQFQPASIDLRLGTEFKIIKNAKFEHLDILKKPDEALKDIINYTEDVRISYNGKFVLHPNEFVLGCTLEYIKIPDNICANIEGKSTWGRVGLEVHSTAGFVDPGFHGSLTFELQNVGKVPIPLYPGLRVAQIRFYQLTDFTNIPYKRKEHHYYAGRQGLLGSSYYKAPELSVIRKFHPRGD